MPRGVAYYLYWQEHSTHYFDFYPELLIVVRVLVRVLLLMDRDDFDEDSSGEIIQLV